MSPSAGRERSKIIPLIETLDLCPSLNHSRPLASPGEDNDRNDIKYINTIIDRIMIILMILVAIII